MLGDKIYKPIDDRLAEYSALANWCNSNSAHIEDKGDYYEAVATSKSTAQQNAEEVLQLKQYLAETDYAVIKCYDRGLVFATEYPDLYARREQARQRIRELEN